MGLLPNCVVPKLSWVSSHPFDHLPRVHTEEVANNTMQFQCAGIFCRSVPWRLWGTQLDASLSPPRFSRARSTSSWLFGEEVLGKNK